MARKILLSFLILFITGTYTASIADDLDKAKEFFAQRDIKEKLEEGIKLMEHLISKDTTHDMAVLLSRSYYFLAEHTDVRDTKLEVYNKGMEYGEIAMNTIEEFAKARLENKKEEAALKALNKDNIISLYWTAANLARWAKFAPFIKKVAAKSRVRALWDRVYEIDPNYNYAGGYRFFGGYYALVPAITGDQDPDKAKEMFDKCLEIAPEYLETKVLYAEAYCAHAKIADRELFKKLLNEVLDFDLESKPELRPENKIAQGKARKLLEQESELFD